MTYARNYSLARPRELRCSLQRRISLIYSVGLARSCDRPPKLLEAVDLDGAVSLDGTYRMSSPSALSKHRCHHSFRVANTGMTIGRAGSDWLDRLPRSMTN